MGRTLAATALPAGAVAVSWTRLEEPGLGREVAFVALVAVIPALLRKPLQRWLGAAATTAAAAWIAFGSQPWELVPLRDERVVGPLLEAVDNGIGDYYTVVLPFDPASQPEMHALLLVAVFGFVLAIALLGAARRPLGAAAVTVAGVGWPATLLGEGAVAVGALALAAALSIPLFLGARTGLTAVQGSIIAALVVAGAAWASSATSFTGTAVLDWQSWNFRGASAEALGVRVVWNAQYDGIRFPPTKTTVLRIGGTDRAQYWKAGTLDEFIADRWYEDLARGVLREASGPLLLDALTPPNARKERNWLEQRVEVRALVDDRLVAAGTPVSIDASSLGTVFASSGGVMRAHRTLTRGTRYRVWSYVADPAPSALASAPKRYPASARQFLSIWGRSLPAYGAAGRGQLLDDLLDDPSYSDFGAYRPLYEQALRVTAGARSPYAAVLALESWFRQRGGFRYEEQPPLSNRPPLVHFVTSSRAGYCQHFAGAMAVMARLLGIPARVAVGFTSGKYEDGAWTVSDHNAHAWVEVWFPRYGWVPFDPTPGRGTFSALYSFASNSAQTVDALRRGALESLVGPNRGRGSTDDFVVPAAPGRASRPSILALGLVLAGALGAAIGTAKWSVRRYRYLTVDPRRAASASRRELESFLRDQAIAVPSSATLEDLRCAVAEGLGLDGSAFADAASRGRFGSPREAPRAARAARKELRALLKRARGELSVWARLRGFVSLRSLRGWQG
jgi:transglutaminase-like putative cysteine protease